MKRFTEFAVAAATLTMILTTSNARAQVVADSLAEFSLVQGLDNWYYGYLVEHLNSDLFQEFPATSNCCCFGPYWWTGENVWTSMWDYGGHPNGLSGNQGRLRRIDFAVRRWISEVEGPITIEGFTGTRDCFDSGCCAGGTTDAIILIDGVEVWRRTVTTTTPLAYTVLTEVSRDSIIDFVIDSRGDDVNDGTTFTAAISAVPIEVFDPNDFWLENGEVVRDAGLLGLPSVPTVRGLAADGVTQVVCRIETPESGIVRLRVLDENGNETNTVELGELFDLLGDGDAGTSVEIPVFQVNEEQLMAFATLRAPLDFARDAGDHPLTMRTLELEASFTPSGQQEPQFTTSRGLELHRPPVVLIHGIWGSLDSWENDGIDWSLLEDSRFTVYRHDYRQSNAREFEFNVPQIRLAVRNARDLIRFENHIAATQADVFGHSMGGLLSRLFISSQDGYRRNDNFNQGDIHKLITVDTPHQGSALANLLIEDPWVGVPYNWLNPVYQGGVDDLRTDSGPISTLPTAVVPAHAIVGTGGADAIANEFFRLPKALNALVTLLTWFEMNISDVLGGEHDVIVNRESQRGQLSGLPVTEFGYIDSDRRGIHFDSVTVEQRIGDLAVTLLNASTDNAIFAPEFPANGGAYPSPPPFNPPRGDEIEIIDPAPGSIIQAGEPLDVTVQPIGQYVPDRVLVSSSFDIDFVTSEPWVITLDVPNDYVGPAVLQAFALDAKGMLAESIEVPVVVETTANLIGIDAEPDVLQLFEFAPSGAMWVMGEYDDGEMRDISSSQVGTTYESLDESIAVVDKEGVVTGIADGQTMIVARNGGFQGEVAVVVVGFTEGSPAALASVEVIIGSLLDGELSDLVESDDQYVHTRSGFGETISDLHKVEMIVNAVTTVDAPATFDLTIETRIDEPSGVARLLLRNQNTNSFVEVGDYTIGLEEEIVTIEDIDATNYVGKNGEIELMLKHNVFRPFLAFQFDSFFDWVRIVVR